MIEIDPETLEIAREEARDGLAKIESNILAVEKGNEDPRLIDALFRDAHSIKGAASMVGWQQVSSLAHGIEDTLEGARAQGSLPAEAIDPLLKAIDELRRAIDVATPKPPGEEVSPAETTPPASPTPRQSEPAVKPQRAMRVDAEKVDRMLDAVGETVLHHRRLEHLVGESSALADEDAAEEELDRGERLLGDLQESVIEMRTLPLSSITSPFPRAVRDLAIADGKEVELAIYGAETQLDRVILEGIGDPIVHLLRNAVAHGVEDPDERERIGKPRRGRLELRAEQRGGMVAIEVADDGRGVSQELLAKSREGGSLTDLLTTPGLSSSAEAGELAGRGVGLDAVKRHVEALGGSVEARSEPARGTKVILLLPITLALLEVLLVERGGRPFGLPVSSVREIFSSGETRSLEGRPIVERRGEAIPFADLATMVGAPAPPLPSTPPAIVVASATRTLAVACDRLLGDRELVVKSLGPLLAGVDGYLGAGLLEDGRVALVVDPNRLLDGPSPDRLPALARPGAERVPPKILVVDDQFSVRRLQSSILEAAGYRVETASNGREALQRIMATPDVDLVLTDLQMPEMDGIELLRAVREDETHKSLPVVVVTSQGSPEERRRGAEEGADAYIVKQEFNQQSLLETIKRLVGG